MPHSTDRPPVSGEPSTEDRIESDTERLHREFGYLLDLYGRRDDESGHWANCRRIIESLARASSPPPLDALEVEAWVAGYIAGREEDAWRTDDEIAERAVDAVCALHMDDAARLTADTPEEQR